MTPVPPESTTELQNRLRQQLILAQVRIMELEDERDTLAPKVQELTGLLQAAQALADQKLDESAHLAKVLADTQAHAVRLQALVEEVQQAHAAARQTIAAAQARMAQNEADLADLRVAADAQAARSAAFEANIAALKRTRSWRWTAWLRAIGRMFAAGSHE